MQMLASACDSLLTPDYIAASQQWILLVERLLRRIVEALGGSTTSARPDSQDDLESVFDSAVSELFRVIAQDEEHKEIGERLCNLLLFLFSWREAGWNWRNKVAHGLMEPKELNVFTAIHAYLACVCLISLVDTKSSSGEERSDRDAAQST
jgi:hypothetical protein